jgi:iron complex outermembrane receptor protein
MHFFALLVFLFAAAISWGQEAAVSGIVRNSAEKPIAGARVALVSLDNEKRWEVLTDSQGIFRIGTLVAGNYNLELDHQGARISTKLQIIQPAQVINVGSLVLDAAAANLSSPQDSAAAAGQKPLEPAEKEIEPVKTAVTVTARRVEEELQNVPVPVSVINAGALQSTQAFNVNRLKELVPTVQFYTSNPRNSAINIRGLGSPFGLTNDGIEPGVGFYVDGVFYARPASATMDFLDLERVEVLRGPQGTLYGKNTTAGAISITSRKPSFVPETNFELNFGNVGFIQAKGSVSGPLGRKVAARISFSGTQRDGMLKNVRTGDDVNDLNNLGVRTQLLITPTSTVSILLAADYSRQRPKGYAQTIAGVAPTLRPANRQYEQMAADLGYRPPSFNAFDRLVDTDTPWRSTQDLAGASATINWAHGKGVLTSITGWRWWDWRPSNDRDFTGLPITTISAAPSKHRQITQEVRWAAAVSSRLNYLVGFFTFNQALSPSGYHKQEQGSAAARFLLAPSAAASTPGLLDGYGQNIDFDYRNTSSAVFGQVEYAITNRLRITPGLRYNYDQKTLNYDQTVYGGLQTTNAALIALQRSILSPLAYKADIGDHNVSGQLTLAHKTTERINTYATYSTGFKSVGLNLGGVPTDAAGAPIVSAAVVRPERVRHVELGLKSQLRSNVTANLAVFNTGIRNFQTQVVNAQVGVLRGYLANADKVRVRGIEVDVNAQVTPELNVYSAIAFTDGRYVSFPDAPPPLEETGGPQVKDVSGSTLPGISRWAFSAGAEYARRKTFLTVPGEYFYRLDTSFRSRFSSNPSASRYLIAPTYGLLNPRVGFRTVDGWSISVWARNLTNSNYFEFLSPAPGNSGLYVGLPGDYRTFGITIARSFQWK